MQVVVGAQWGDEGKGKVVDALAENADLIVRYQGGNNAGHTVIIGDETFKLHLVPSGICRGKTSVLGNGVVIHPIALHKEIVALNKRGIETKGKLWLSDRAHLILNTHIERDQAQEEKRSKKVGTTNKGIGPAYTDKVQRCGVRLGQWKRCENLTKEEIESLTYLTPYIDDTTHRLHQALESKQTILLEGAQGTFLDIDHGTYPFVTSSNCTSGGASTGTGLPPTAIKDVIGILKAYTTRVGNGPFPTELEDKNGEYLQEKGHEFGTTTGRRRRCGWLDLVMAKYAQRINGINHWCITKLDVLSGLDELKVCTGYTYKGQKLNSFPSDLEILSQVELEYASFKGWNDDITQCQSISELPLEAQDYLNFISEFTSTPITWISVGPERNQLFKSL